MGMMELCIWNGFIAIQDFRVYYMASNMLSTGNRNKGKGNGAGLA